MALYSDTSLQNLVLKDAICFDDLHSTPLIIHFDARDGDGHGQLTMHLENAPLALALRDAINEVLNRYLGNAEPAAEAEVAA